MNPHRTYAQPRGGNTMPRHQKPGRQMGRGGRVNCKE